MLLLLALLQAVTTVPPERIDLTIPQPCQADRPVGGEIVVCANRDGDRPYRLKQPAPPRKTELPKAQMNIAEGVSAGIETEEADVGGFPSKRAMVRLKIKF